MGQGGETGKAQPDHAALPCLSAKLFRVGERDFLCNTATGQSAPISRQTRAALEPCGDGHGGLTLPRGDPAADDLMPFAANPFSDATVARAISGQLRMLVLELTRNCNLACAYCIDGDAYGQKTCLGNANMSAETGKRAIDLLARGARADDTPLILSFYGGEPLLRFDLMRALVAHAHEVAGPRGVAFSVTTNGTLLSDEVVDFLVREDFQLVVSLDGPAPVHDAFRLTKKGAPTHRRIMRALIRLRARHPGFHDRNLLLSIVVTPGMDLTGLQAFFDAMGTHVIANFVESYGLTMSHDTRPRAYPGLDALAGALAARLRAHGPDYPASDAGRRDFAASLLRSVVGAATAPCAGTGAQPLGQCIPGTSRLHVAADGALYPCEKLAGHSVTRIGHVATGIDKDRAAALLRAFYDLVSPHCRGCWMAPGCTMCLALCASGDALDPQKLAHYCTGMKAQGEFALAFAEALA